jgi:uncharacterized delta-60 repeat protein
MLDDNFRAPFFAYPLPPTRELLLPGGKYVLYGSEIETLADRPTGAVTRYLADGTLDNSFNFTRDYRYVTAVAALPNQQLLVSATQYTYTNILGTDRILRLNADGSIDSTFASPMASYASFPLVGRIVLQPDGRILVSGSFDDFDGTGRHKIVRLLPDGTIDTSFNPPEFGSGTRGLSGRPVTLADGKILLRGNFTTVNGTATLPVVRLNPDGSLDSSFQASGFTATNVVRGLVVQNDGKIVLGGSFKGLSRSPAPLWRLNSDGSTDSTYIHQTLSPGTAYDLVLQSDGKVVGALAWSIYRFNPDGSLDATFRKPDVIDALFYPYGVVGTPFSIDLQADGRVLFGGEFTDVDPPNVPDWSHFGVARLDASGNLDPTLVTTHRTGVEAYPTSFIRLADGSTLAGFGSGYSPIQPPMTYNLGRLFPDGSLDPSFRLSSSTPESVLYHKFLAQDFTEIADGTLFVFGLAWNEDQEFVVAGAKFSPGGVENIGFQLDPSIRSIGAASPLPDGTVLLSVGGSDAQATLDGLLSRLRSGGRLDSTFQLDQSIASRAVVRDASGRLIAVYAGSRVLGVQPDGKILFVALLSDKLFHLIRLNQNGSIDASFHPTTLQPFDLVQTFPVLFDYLNPTGALTLQPSDGVWAADPQPMDAELLPDGRIVLAGRFTSFQGVTARGVVQLRADGTLDDSFSAGGGAQWIETDETSTFFPFVEAVEAQVDGKLLIAGSFEAFNGTAMAGLARLNSDGSVDPSFTPLGQRLKFRRGGAKLARQADGSFLLSGPYSTIGGTEPAFIHLNYVGGIPVVGSPRLATAVVGRAFRYQVVASGQPSSYSAAGLPASFSIDPATGIITGTPTAAEIGVRTVLLRASNAEGSGPERELSLNIPDFPRPIAAVSRKWYSTPIPLDLDLPVTGPPGVECRFFSSSDALLLVMTFNNDLISAEASVTLGDGTAYEAAPDGQTLTVYIGDLVDAQVMTITLHNVKDAFEQAMPDSNFQIALLMGDANGDGRVNVADTNMTKRFSGQLTNASNVRCDVNFDGRINVADANFVKAHAGRSLPPAGGIPRASDTRDK